VTTHDRALAMPSNALVFGTDARSLRHIRLGAGLRIGQACRVKHVVVIEDHVDTADLMQEIIGALGHDVTTAHTGREGIAAAVRVGADLVLCDVGLPDIDGYAVARALRADASTARARLIALTGYDGEEERGFDLHVVKPIDPLALEDLIGI
jgi:CheY-like chemotaxis protein